MACTAAVGDSASKAQLIIRACSCGTLHGSSPSSHNAPQPSDHFPDPSPPSVPAAGLRTRGHSPGPAHLRPFLRGGAPGAGQRGGCRTAPLRSGAGPGRAGGGADGQVMRCHVSGPGGGRLSTCPGGDCGGDGGPGGCGGPGCAVGAARPRAGERAGAHPAYGLAGLGAVPLQRELPGGASPVHQVIGSAVPGVWIPHCCWRSPKVKAADGLCGGPMCCFPKERACSHSARLKPLCSDCQSPGRPLRYHGGRVSTGHVSCPAVRCSSWRWRTG